MIRDAALYEQVQYRDFAILYRTNAQSRIFEESMRKMNIPYKVYGGVSFFQRKEVKDVLAYFRVIVNPADDESLKRIINYPLRGIGKTTLDRIEAAATGRDVPLWEVLTDGTFLRTAFNTGTHQKMAGFVGMIHEFRQKAGRNGGLRPGLHCCRQPPGSSGNSAPTRPLKGSAGQRTLRNFAEQHPRLQ